MPRTKWLEGIESTLTKNTKLQRPFRRPDLGHQAYPTTIRAFYKETRPHYQQDSSPHVSFKVLSGIVISRPDMTMRTLVRQITDQGFVIYVIVLGNVPVKFYLLSKQIMP
jgi:hypothetical protein